MGIIAEIEAMEEKVLSKQLLAWTKLRICELGNQYNHMQNCPAKEVYLKRQVIEHISIDLNGQDGAIALDLDNPLPVEFIDRFNFITNYGTSEHVNNQHQLFKNIHDACCLGGLMIHALIPPEHWRGHGRYYYPSEFVGLLASLCKYETILHEEVSPYPDLPRNLLLVAYKKTQLDFITPKTFANLPLVDSGNKINTGNYHASKHIN
jgi:hypothetical protein